MDILYDIIEMAVTTYAMETQEDNGCSMPQSRLTAIQGVFNAVTDVIILAMSVGLTLGLRISFKNKLGICAIFLVGVLYVGRCFLFGVLQLTCEL